MLHVGGVRTALFNWLFARKNDGVFVLRIEDTDLERSTEESVEQLKRSLRWIGLDWDEGPELGGPFAPYQQTERFAIYREAAQRLIENGAAYYDFATSEELTEFRETARREGRQPIYSGGEYRDMDPDEALKRVRQGEDHTVRFKTPREGQTVVQDEIRGPVTFENANLEDFVLMKSTNTPTYNFAAAVDDAEMEISHVIRGDDHLSNTPRQILIYNALSYDPPGLRPRSRRCSARTRRSSPSATARRASRSSRPRASCPRRSSTTWRSSGRAMRRTRRSSPPKSSPNVSVLSGSAATRRSSTRQKLLSINQVYIRKQSPEELAMQAAPMLAEAGVADTEELESDMPRLIQIMELLKERISRTTDIPDAVGYFYGGSLEYDPEEFQKQFGKEFVQENFAELRERLAALPEWNEETIEEAIRGLAAEKEKGARHLIHPLRFATTGRTVSAGLFETLALLGRERSLLRIDDATQEMRKLN